MPFFVRAKPATRTTDGATASAARAAAEGRGWVERVCSTAASMSCWVMRGAGGGMRQASQPKPANNTVASTAAGAPPSQRREGRARDGPAAPAGPALPGAAAAGPAGGGSADPSGKGYGGEAAAGARRELL